MRLKAWALSLKVTRYHLANVLGLCAIKRAVTGQVYGDGNGRVATFLRYPVRYLRAATGGLLEKRTLEISIVYNGGIGIVKGLGLRQFPGLGER